MMTSYSWVLAKVIGLTGNPLAGPIAMGITKFTDVLVQMTQKTSERNIWQSIEHKLLHKIDTRIAQHHFNTLVGQFGKFEGYMKKRATLTVTDLDAEIVGMMSQFLPQTFDYTVFTTQWMTAFPAYLTYMVAAYNELIREGKIQVYIHTSLFSPYFLQVILIQVHLKEILVDMLSRGMQRNSIWMLQT